MSAPPSKFDPLSETEAAAWQVPSAPTTPNASAPGPLAGFGQAIVGLLPLTLVVGIIWGLVAAGPSFFFIALVIMTVLAGVVAPSGQRAASSVAAFGLFVILVGFPYILIQGAVTDDEPIDSPSSDPCASYTPTSIGTDLNRDYAAEHLQKCTQDQLNRMNRGGK